jgi:hypothetical protein
MEKNKKSMIFDNKTFKYTREGYDIKRTVRLKKDYTQEALIRLSQYKSRFAHNHDLTYID